MLPPPRTPNQEELANAINSGERVAFGLPVHVKELGHDYDIAFWALNLEDARKGAMDPWHYVRKSGSIIELESSNDAGFALIIDGEAREISESNIGFFRRAIRVAPKPGTRHDPEADWARKKAGKFAMDVSNQHVRAYLMDMVDGWTCLEDAGRIVDKDSKHGVLVEPPDEMGLNTKVLIVTCPSTGRKYGLLVPQDMKTAKEARLWTFGGIEPEVET